MISIPIPLNSLATVPYFSLISSLFIVVSVAYALTGSLCCRYKFAVTVFRFQGDAADWRVKYDAADDDVASTVVVLIQHAQNEMPETAFCTRRLNVVCRSGLSIVASVFRLHTSRCVVSTQTRHDWTAPSLALRRSTAPFFVLRRLSIYRRAARAPRGLARCSTRRSRQRKKENQYAWKRVDEQRHKELWHRADVVARRRVADILVPACRCISLLAYQRTTVSAHDWTMATWQWHRDMAS